MSPTTSGFTFTNTAAATTTVPNPCYGYLSMSSGTVKSNCQSIAGQINSTTLNGNAFMNVSASSDNPQVNDVLYAGSGDAVFLDYGTVSPASPYTGTGSYSLNTYNTNPGGFSETYASVTPSGNAKQTTPTNAGYVPFSPQVMYVKRGFGYGGSQSAFTGNTVVPMGTDPSTTSGANLFAAALAPETNSASSGEIKAVAGQSAIAGLLQGARSYLGGVSHVTCQSQYVVLMTDGLPTLDYGDGSHSSSVKTWPPLGTITGNAYNLTASFDPTTGAFLSSNSQAVTDAITAVTALNAAGVKVYVIGLGAGVDRTTNPTAYSLLQAMAIAGGTSNFFPANDPTSLNAAFQTIVAQIYAAKLGRGTAGAEDGAERLVVRIHGHDHHAIGRPRDGLSGRRVRQPDGRPGVDDRQHDDHDRPRERPHRRRFADRAVGADGHRFRAACDRISNDMRTDQRDDRRPIRSTRTRAVPCLQRDHLPQRTRQQHPARCVQSAGSRMAFSGPPSNGLLIQNSSYLTWARNHATRPEAGLVHQQRRFPVRDQRNHGRVGTGAGSTNTT